MKRSVRDFGKRSGWQWRFSAVLLLLFAAGCSGGGGSSSVDATTSDQAFPASLAVASPLDLGTDSGAAALARGQMSRSAIATQTDNQYNAITEQINEILEGTTASACVFDPQSFYQSAVNAACYGPSVKYENHPDEISLPSGELPVGDLGIWLAVDTPTGDACAAAELNARMEGIQARTMAALSGLAAMVCTVNTSDGTLHLPDADATSVDLTSAMPAPAGVTLNSAVLTYGTTTGGEDKYGYTLDFDYNSDHIVVQMTHIPNASSTSVYRGQVSYRISTTVDGGSNCSPDPGTPVTRNGSLVYNRTAASALSLEMRDAQFCGTDVDGMNADEVVDATRKFVLGDEPNGWGDDFNLFRADFDPQTQLGDYVYSWQAGCNDGNTRVFNLMVYDDGDDATEDLDAVAFFGYGDDAATTDPSIKGFIFNWAGPGSDGHTIYEYAQKQEVSYNATTGHFDSASAHITYAPTNAGTYDGLGSFRYDADADGTVDTDAAVAISLDMAEGTDDGTGSVTIEKTIADAGIAVPTAPTCSECTPD